MFKNMRKRMEETKREAAHAVVELLRRLPDEVEVGIRVTPAFAVELYMKIGNLYKILKTEEKTA